MVICEFCGLEVEGDLDAHSLECEVPTEVEIHLTGEDLVEYLSGTDEWSEMDYFGSEHEHDEEY